MAKLYNGVVKQSLEGTTIFKGFIRCKDESRVIWTESTGIFRNNYDDAKEDATSLAREHWLLNNKEVELA